MRAILMASLLFTTGFGLILMVPTFDMENGPIDLFIFDHGDSLEITVVFSDEDHPDPVEDVLYDVYRFFKWGRVEDVETFFVMGHSVFFPDDYASVTSFFQTEDLHTRMEIPLSDFERLSGELVVYVNTWNHMFSEKPLPGVPYIPIRMNGREGTRETAEKIYSWKH